ncbi:MAG: DUF2892 domain-containing protein [Methylotetracoccus sp.]|jgi:hypothetical protein|nr:DUF2892 domain-containing protein [Methylotetracoccus sp.]
MAFDYKRMMQRELNVGLKDQKIRYAAGCTAILISVFLGNIPLLLLGAVLVVTARLRWCPVYSGMTRSTVDPNEDTSGGCCGGGHGAH